MSKIPLCAMFGIRKLAYFHDGSGLLVSILRECVHMIITFTVPILNCYTTLEFTLPSVNSYSHFCWNCGINFHSAPFKFPTHLNGGLREPCKFFDDWHGVKKMLIDSHSSDWSMILTLCLRLKAGWTAQTAVLGVGISPGDCTVNTGTDPTLYYYELFMTYPELISLIWCTARGGSPYPYYMEVWGSLTSFLTSDMASRKEKDANWFSQLWWIYDFDAMYGVGRLVLTTQTAVSWVGISPVTVQCTANTGTDRHFISCELFYDLSKTH